MLKPLDQQHKNMRFEFKYDDVKCGIEMSLDELATFGECVLKLAENEISVQDIMTVVMSGHVPDSFKPEKKNTPVKAEDLLKREEKSEEPEEATDEDEREELVKKLKETGVEILKYGDDDFIECHTFCDRTSNMEKAGLVRAWLKSKSIKYKIDSNGIKKYVYQLSPIQLVELQRYLKDNEVVSYDCVI